jgi:hypothetical protein
MNLLITNNTFFADCKDATLLNGRPSGPHTKTFPLITHVAMRNLFIILIRHKLALTDSRTIKYVSLLPAAENRRKRVRDGFDG